MEKVALLKDMEPDPVRRERNNKNKTLESLYW